MLPGSSLEDIKEKAPGNVGGGPSVISISPEERAMSDDHKARMQPRPEASPGLETDGKGNVIPFDQPTRDDQAAASRSVKDPEKEAEAPASMPPEQQGQGGTPRPDDPAGQQGGYHE